MKIYILLFPAQYRKTNRQTGAPYNLYPLSSVQNYYRPIITSKTILIRDSRTTYTHPLNFPQRFPCEHVYCCPLYDCHFACRVFGLYLPTVVQHRDHGPHNMHFCTTKKDVSRKSSIGEIRCPSNPWAIRSPE